MRVGVGISEDIPVRDQQHLARAVEEAGFSSLWTNESSGRDALLLCQAWAAATAGLEVGIGVSPLWTRSPTQLAMAAATLQEASGGRFLLGLGVSHAATMEAWHGVAYRRPLDAARETVAVLRAVFSGEPTDVEGGVVSSHGFRLNVTPRPRPPRLYLAAMGPRMLRLAGTVADGVLLNWSRPEAVAASVAAVRAAAAGSGVGRSPAGVEVAAYLRVAVDDDLDAARRALARQVSSYAALPAYAAHFSRQGFADAVAEMKAAYRRGGPDAAADAVPETMLAALGWYGTPEQAPTRAVGRYAAAGLDHLVARVVVVGDDPTASIRRTLTALARPPIDADG